MDAPMFGYMNMATLWVASCYLRPAAAYRPRYPNGENAYLLHSSDWVAGNDPLFPHEVWAFPDGSVAEIAVDYADVMPVVDVGEIDANIALRDD